MLPAGRLDLVENRIEGRIVGRRDEDQIGTGRSEFVDARRMSQRSHHRLALRWARGDRGTLYGEVFAAKVDVVQLFPVDVARGLGIADDRVVFPAVPQLADHLDGVGGFVEQFVGIGGRIAPAEQRGFVGRRAHPRLPTCSSVRHMIQCRDGLGEVERLGVGDGGHRDQTDVLGDRGDSRRDEDGVAAAGQPPRAERFTPSRLGLQGVVDGEEIQ